MYHMQMTTDPEVRTTTVTRRNGDPFRVEVHTTRWTNNNRYTVDYRFRMDGSTAVLIKVTPDGDSFPVRSNTETARLARDAVQALPFVQAVTMYPDLDDAN